MKKFLFCQLFCCLLCSVDSYAEMGNYGRYKYPYRKEDMWEWAYRNARGCFSLVRWVTDSLVLKMSKNQSSELVRGLPDDGIYSRFRGVLESVLKKRRDIVTKLEYNMGYNRWKRQYVATQLVMLLRYWAFRPVLEMDPWEASTSLDVETPVELGEHFYTKWTGMVGCEITYDSFEDTPDEELKIIEGQIYDDVVICPQLLEDALDSILKIWETDNENIHSSICFL
jgi:hypothetical protein